MDNSENRSFLNFFRKKTPSSQTEESFSDPELQKVSQDRKEIRDLLHVGKEILQLPNWDFIDSFQSRTQTLSNEVVEILTINDEGKILIQPAKGMTSTFAAVSFIPEKESIGSIHNHPVSLPPTYSDGIMTCHPDHIQNGIAVVTLPGDRIFCMVSTMSLKRILSDGSRSSRYYFDHGGTREVTYNQFYNKTIKPPQNVPPAELESFMTSSSVQAIMKERILPTLAHDLRSLYQIYLYEGSLSNKALKLVNPSMDPELDKVRKSMGLEPIPGNSRRRDN